MEKIAALILSFAMTVSAYGVAKDKTEKIKEKQAQDQIREVVPWEPEIEVIAEEPVQEEAKSSVEGKIILIDAGHGITNIKRKEAVAPNSSEMKAAHVSGTSGKNQTEEALNLSVALKLSLKLEDMGAKVYMTRQEHMCDLSNIERAQMGNNLNADITVRIHADGSSSKSAKGVSVLIPGSKYIKDAAMLEKSKRAGEGVLNEFVAKTGANNRGTVIRNDLTGFNWSTVPVILVEMGFMSNPEEDSLMETEDYQTKIAEGIAGGLETYFAK